MADEKQHDFLAEFIRLWEVQLDIVWDVGKNDFTFMSEEGPHLSLLPDEFLPSLDKHLFQLKIAIEKEVSREDLASVTKTVKGLVILSRNLDNIPFIGSCQFVSSCISISTIVVNKLAKDKSLEWDGVNCIVLMCLFLESLYDPYFSYRKSIKNQSVDSSKIKYQPALLHAEVIPFIYDCFQHSKADSYPLVAHSLLFLFGAIIKGAQHNAVKAITPATVQILQKAFLHSQVDLQLATSVLHCETAMIHTLLNTRPDQCQIELGEVVEIYQNTLGLLAGQDVPDYPELGQQKANNRSEIICLAVETIATFLIHQRRESLQVLFARTGIVDFLIMLLFDAKLIPEEKRTLIVVIIKTMTAVLQDNKHAQELISNGNGYKKLFEAMKSLGEPTRSMIDSLIGMGRGRELSFIDEEDAVIRNVEPIEHLIDWLPGIQDHELQVSTATSIAKLCSSSLQSKALCCQRGLLIRAIAVLEHHSKLDIRSVHQILRLIQSLGSHSITAAELKLLLRLMRDADGRQEEYFPYSAYVLHCLSSMAKKDATSPECHYYFDIQHESEGIVVSDIAQWQNPGYGLSVCCWVRLDSLENPGSASNFRRQLFNLSSNKGHFFESFFLSDGTLLACVSSKKEYTTAMVHNVILNDHQWHSICITFSPSRRLFGQNQLSVYVDGTMRLSVQTRLPPVNEAFSALTIGAPIPATQTPFNKEDASSFYSISRKKSDIRSQGLSPKTPNYFSLPITLTSLKSLSNEQNDPEVRTIPLGSQDSIWGKPTCLHGQIGLFSLFHESLSLQNVRTFHEAGANSTSIWNNDDANLDVSEFFSKVAICLSARGFHNAFVQDLSSNHQFNGFTKAPVCTTWDVKDVLRCIGGVPALFPILETVIQNDVVESLLIDPLSTPVAEKPDVEGWEVLPSSTYADWKLQQNPVSGFLFLLRNVLHHANNTEQLLQGSNIAIIGSLMQKVHPSLVDVQVLMAVQLLIEFARDAQEPSFLHGLYQYILFDMRIWGRSQFHVRIGHVQYLTNLVREDRSFFRKKYGTQYVLDVIKQHYHNEEHSDLSQDDRKTMRQALLGIFKLYINKEVTVSDMTAMMGFLWSVRDNEMIIEVLDVLLTYVESKHNKDQFYLLILEPRCAEILYALLLEKIFTVELREKVLKLIINVLKTDRVYEKSKLRLYLHDCNGFQGLICLMQGQTSSLEITHLLTDIILSRDHLNSYTGAMAIAYSLAEENLEIKLEFSKRLLGFLLSRPNAPVSFVKQTSWQECLARLLIKKPISASGNTGVKPMVPDLIDLDVEATTYGSFSTPTPTATPSSPSKIWPTTPGLNASGLGIGTQLEQDIKDVAESVSNLVAGAVTGNLNNIAIATGNLQNAAEVLSDNLQNVAENFQTNIHSAAATAYSIFKQKTLQVQGSLEGLGENTIQRLKRRSQSLHGAASEPLDSTDAGASTDSSPRLRHPYKFLVAPLEVAVDALYIEQGDEEFQKTKIRESSLSVSSRTSATSATSSDIRTASKNLIDFGLQESLDIETYSMISEVSGQWSGLVLDPTLDPEEDLCSTVLSIYLVLLWRGIPGSSKDDWRERNQILSCINLLGLNNELYRSHLEIKRRLIEMILQTGVNELKQLSNTSASRNNILTNCQYAVRWVYDLVLLDPHEDEAKKMSGKLLDLTLALFDAMSIFQEDDLATKKSSEIYHIAIGLLVRFSSSSNAAFCAMASARLHAILQFNSHPDANEVGFLVYNINCRLQSVLGKDEESDCYACLIPIMKAALEKAGWELEFEPIHTVLSFPDEVSNEKPPLTTNLFDKFQLIIQQESWKLWIEDKVRSKSDRFRSVHLQGLQEVMNRSWAESDESAMLDVHRRNREVSDSKIKFQMHILDGFRTRQSEEHTRYNNLLSHQRGHALVIRKKWRQLKQFLIGPRGSWAQRTNIELRWKLSPCENRSRMRLKLVPNPHFDPHIQASRLRDNTAFKEGRPITGSDVQNSDSLNCLLPTTVANQALKMAINAQEPEDSLTEEDLALAASLEKEELGEGKEKVTTSEECELVTLMSVIKGRIEISRGWICFWDSGLGNEVDRERVDFKFALHQLQEVHLRRYNLRRSALEFFLTDHTNYFVNFTTKTRNRIYSRILSLRPPNLLYHSSRSPADVLRSSGLTQKWVQREISNFDYLMQLNTIAGRTYNDLSQYPVFPWILADYQSQTLDLKDPDTFRDLSRPIGVVNPKNAKEVRAKYEHFEDPSGTISKFHYGTHYSNAAGVLHYLVRMEPFTSLHIELQSGRFDVADRQFHSLASTWRLLMDNPNDVKELIPEFYSSPEFLVNMNRLDLGVLQASKKTVDDVELPPWAKSPHDFIYQHRKALESDFVSANLHNWIDLIFGYKQRGPAAVEALNVFYYCSYEGAVDLDAITDPIERQAVEGMINHFGQTPCQLFKEPHPVRLSPLEVLSKSKYPPSIHLYLERLSCVYLADLVVEPRDYIVHLAIPNPDLDPTRSRGYGYQTAATPDVLVSVSRSGCIGLHSWGSQDKLLPNGFSLDRDPTISNPRSRRSLNESFHPSVKLNSRLICISSDCKVLYVGGQLDNSVKVYGLPRLRVVGSATKHIDIVTCLALDEAGSQLITGSRDTTCIVWEVSTGASGAIALKALQVLYGHDQSLTCVGLLTALDLAVSGSLDGTVNVHTIKEGNYIRTLQAAGQPGIDRIIITQLWISERGDVVFTAEEKNNFSIHSYTVNGERIGLSYNPFAFSALSAGGEGYVVCGDSSGEVSIRRILGLVPTFEIPMQSPIEDLVVAPRNTQLLVALRDSKVVVVAPSFTPGT